MAVVVASTIDLFGRRCRVTSSDWVGRVLGCGCGGVVIALQASQERGLGCGCVCRSCEGHDGMMLIYQSMSGKFESV